MNYIFYTLYLLDKLMNTKSSRMNASIVAVTAQMTLIFSVAFSTIFIYIEMRIYIEALILIIFSCIIQIVLYRYYDPRYKSVVAEIRKKSKLERVLIVSITSFILILTIVVIYLIWFNYVSNLGLPN